MVGLRLMVTKNSLDVAAQTMGISVRNTGLLKENDPIEEIDLSGSISMTMFSIQEKEISSPIYTYQGVGLGQLMKIESPRQAKFDEVKQEVTEDFTALKKKGIAFEQINKVKQGLRSKRLRIWQKIMLWSTTPSRSIKEDNT